MCMSKYSNVSGFSVTECITVTVCVIHYVLREIQVAKKPLSFCPGHHQTCRVFFQISELYSHPLLSRTAKCNLVYHRCVVLRNELNAGPAR